MQGNLIASIGSNQILPFGKELSDEINWLKAPIYAEIRNGNKVHQRIIPSANQNIIRWRSCKTEEKIMHQLCILLVLIQCIGESLHNVFLILGERQLQKTWNIDRLDKIVKKIHKGSTIVL